MKIYGVSQDSTGIQNLNIGKIPGIFLRRLCDMDNLRGLPSLVGGDFNEICYNSEKFGGQPKSESPTFEFRETLDVCSLQDLHCGGEFFTWTNRRSGPNFVMERLDRFTGSFEWRMMYPTARIQSLEFFHSDHRPIILELRGLSGVNKEHILRGHKRFTFEHICGFWIMTVPKRSQWDGVKLLGTHLSIIGFEYVGSF